MKALSLCGFGPFCVSFLRVYFVFWSYRQTNRKTTISGVPLTKKTLFPWHTTSLVTLFEPSTRKCEMLTNWRGVRQVAPSETPRIRRGLSSGRRIYIHLLKNMFMFACCCLRGESITTGHYWRYLFKTTYFSRGLKQMGV